MLRPFGAKNISSDLDFSLSAEVNFQAKHIELAFKWERGLLHPTSTIQGFKAEGSQLIRRDGLWTSTCFEMFWGVSGTSKYWELNLSPWNEWNLYEFESYRSPQPPTPTSDYSLVKMEWAVNGGSGQMSARLESSAVPAGNWEYNLCAVVPNAKGPQYFSLNHPEGKPDFHRRDCMKLWEAR